MMKFNANQIAEALEGVVEGDEAIEVHCLSKIEEGKKGSLTFLSNPKYTRYIYESDASIVIVSEDFKPEKAIDSTLIRVKDPHKCFSKLLKLYQDSMPSKKGIEQPVFIHKSADLKEDVYIGAFAYIGENSTIGDHTEIHPHVHIGEGCTIGKNVKIFTGVKLYANTVVGDYVTIHANTVIGSDGFGFIPKDNDSYEKVPQIGNVIIEDHVEIGSGVTIDCATLGSTIIKKGVKLDNQIHIAHNVEVGENTAIAAQTGIAGSAKIGKSCMIGGQVGIVGHIRIGDYVKIQGKSGISKGIKNNEVLQGSPAFGYSDFFKSYAVFKNLPDIKTQIELIKKDLEAIKDQL